VSTAETNGTICQIYHTKHDDYHLQGTEVTIEFSRPELLELLDRAKAPAIYDGELYWSEELRKVLEN